MEFGDEGQSFARLGGAVDAARESGFAAVSANDHFLFQTPWLDGATSPIGSQRLGPRRRTTA
ncbi:MAG TPA: hypothetical protein VFJ24_10440 [Gaiellales bacterium]|nr:hypothetical protein [Gaiellales bacterium]